MDKQDYLQRFGQNLRRYRLAKGLTQEELALKAGYTGKSARSAINKIEVGVNDPSMSRVKALARALDCTPADLVNCVPPEPEEEAEPEITEAEEDFLEAYRALNCEGRQLALDYLRMLESRYGKKNHTAEATTTVA